jgi:hypothetical protein
LIGAGTEILPGGAQHGDAHVLLDIDNVERIGQVAHQLDADVIVRRPVNLQHRDVVLAPERDVAELVFHAYSAACCCLPRRSTGT